MIWGGIARVSSTAALALAGILAGGAAAAEDPPASATIVGRAYQPGQLTVGLGQTVSWQNQSLTHHTVTSVAGLFDSGSIAPGASYPMTFSSAGTFDYTCTIHPTMKGSVVVLDLAPETLELRLSARRSNLGVVAVARVQAARSGPVLLQTGRGGSWRTVARGVLNAQGRATLMLASPSHRSLRVELPAGLGLPRELSRAERALS